MTKISTGAAFLDQFLQGGYDDDIVTTIYGPSGAGKTNLCLLAAVKIAESGKKVLFIDTEGGIAVERIKQISPRFEEILGRLMFINPLTFEEQKAVFDQLREMVTEQIGLIEVNSALGKQIAYLVEIARRKKIPVLITNQVYSDFDNRDQIKMVGGDLLKYGSKCLIELQKFRACWGLILKKHRSLPSNTELKFKIVREGIEMVE